MTRCSVWTTTTKIENRTVCRTVHQNIKSCELKRGYVGSAMVHHFDASLLQHQRQSWKHCFTTKRMKLTIPQMKTWQRIRTTENHCMTDTTKHWKSCELKRGYVGSGMVHHFDASLLQHQRQSWKHCFTTKSMKLTICHMKLDHGSERRKTTVWQILRNTGKNVNWNEAT